MFLVLSLVMSVGISVSCPCFGCADQQTSVCLTSNDNHHLQYGRLLGQPENFRQFIGPKHIFIWFLV